MSFLAKLEGEKQYLQTLAGIRIINLLSFQIKGYILYKIILEGNFLEGGRWISCLKS